MSDRPGGPVEPSEQVPEDVVDAAVDDAADEATRRAHKVGKKVARGIFWTTTGTIATNAVRVLSLALLGRLLLPADFGVVITAMTVINLVNVVRDVGLGSALVQHRAPTANHVDTAFTVSLLLGAVLAGGIYLGAPAIAAFQEKPHVAPILQALALLTFLRSFGSVANQMCRREMMFREVMAFDFVAYATNVAVAITLAVLGHGPWAIVGGYLAENLVNTGLLLWKFPPRRLRIDVHALRELLRFGSGQTVGSIANAVANQGDYFVVGKRFSDEIAGFYNRAYELVRFPAATFSNVVGTVLFSGFSRLQDDRAHLAAHYRRTMFAIGLILMPASVGLVVLAPEILPVVLGGQWHDAVVPFQIMACGLMFRTNYKVGALIARARGDVYGIATAEVVYAIAVVGGAIISSHWGIFGVAITTTLAIVMMSCLLNGLGMRHADISLRELLACHVPGLWMSLVVGVPVTAVAFLARAEHLPSALVLVAGLATGAIAFLVVGRLALRSAHPDWVWSRSIVDQVLRKVRKRRR